MSTAVLCTSPNLPPYLSRNPVGVTSRFLASLMTPRTALGLQSFVSTSRANMTRFTSRRLSSASRIVNLAERPNSSA